MEVVKISESGYYPALLGLSLSYSIAKNDKSVESYFANFTVDKYKEVAKKLSSKGNGHNKFMQMMSTHWLIRMPRLWWSQFDTYRHAIQAVDDSVAQSESTMHTLLKSELKQIDFEGGIEPNYLNYINEIIKEGNIEKAKLAIPESFLQTRVVMMNYEVLRNVIKQRKNHKLSTYWGYFIRVILKNVDLPELLEEQDGTKG
jgi:hypothetical protein